MANVPPGAADRARALFGDFIEGRWEETRGDFHENFRGHLDAGRIAQGWAHTASSAGGFERVGEPSARQFGEYTLVELPLTFKAGEGTGRAALDQQGRVAGLSIADQGQMIKDAGRGGKIAGSDHEGRLG